MKHLPGISCITVLAVILTLGLWPFHASRNQAAWVKDHNGLRFGDYSTVMSSGTFKVISSSNEPSCSIEIWFQAARADIGGTILSFYIPDHFPGFSVHQSVADLMLQLGTGNQAHRARAARIYVNDVFRQAQPLFVTLTSKAQETSVYVNGDLARTVRHFLPKASDCTGRLILGDSPLQQDTWSGQVRGLAIYISELSSATVLRHYKTWTKNGQPEVARKEHNVALYLFDEHTGKIVHNHAGTDLDLAIPDTYTVLDQEFLEPFWKEFNMSSGYWKNVLKNIVGFIPLGFYFYAYLSLLRHYQRAALITVIAGATVSVIIEVLQAYLPTRQSGTTDLITNTLGTYFGVLAYRAVSPIVAERSPSLALFTAAHPGIGCSR